MQFEGCAWFARCSIRVQTDPLGLELAKRAVVETVHILRNEGNPIAGEEESGDGAVPLVGRALEDEPASPGVPCPDSLGDYGRRLPGSRVLPGGSCPTDPQRTGTWGRLSPRSPRRRSGSPSAGCSAPDSGLAQVPRAQFLRMDASPRVTGAIREGDRSRRWRSGLLREASPRSGRARRAGLRRPATADRSEPARRVSRRI